MEDDVRINAEQSVEPAEQTVEPAEQVDGSAEQAAEPAEQAAEPAEQTAEPAGQAVPSPDWRFGEGGEPPAPTKRKRSGNGGFFAVFGAVFGVCLLLLIGVICLGDGSFQIVRNLKTERVVYVREDDGSSGLLTPNEAADRIAASTVSITVRTADGSGIGSGFVYTADGYILTNHHVIADATSVQVLLPDGMAYDATVVGSDKAGDVAVLKIEATGLIPVQTGSSDDLLVGDELVAVGTPANLNYAGTATFGTVSATARLVPILNTDTGAVEMKSIGSIK
jgi:S1-C subfamily serine protease